VSLGRPVYSAVRSDIGTFGFWFDRSMLSRCPLPPPAVAPCDRTMDQVTRKTTVTMRQASAMLSLRWCMCYPPAIIVSAKRPRNATARKRFEEVRNSICSKTDYRERNGPSLFVFEDYSVDAWGPSPGAHYHKFPDKHMPSETSCPSPVVPRRSCLQTKTFKKRGPVRRSGIESE
jgi:hypothetical protein